MSLVEWGGSWYEEAFGGGHLIEIPGVRPMKVWEMVGGRFRTTRRYGEWIEVDRRTAGLHHDLLRWCRRRCNSELPSGTFRFSPKDWERYREEPLATPFVPELDHPSATIRELARLERERRQVEQEAATARRRRDELVREASAEGHSRREVAHILGVSFGRVQQLVQQSERES